MVIFCAEPNDILQRLVHMEYDVRPHEPYDVAIAVVFIVLMLVMTVLIFALA